MQGAVQDRQVAAPWRQIHSIGLHLHPIRDFHHRHRRALTQQVRQETDMSRVLVGDIWRKKSSMASKPPAEAPIPTIRLFNDGGDGASEGAGAFGDNASFTGRRLTPLCVAPPLAEDVLPGVFCAAATAFSPWHD